MKNSDFAYSDVAKRPKTNPAPKFKLKGYISDNDSIFAEVEFNVEQTLDCSKAHGVNLDKSLQTITQSHIQSTDQIKVDFQKV